MRKTRFLALALTIALCCMALLAVGCGKPAPEPSHTHTYSSAWKSDATYHWHAATCEHSSEVKDLKPHTFDKGVVTKEPTATETGVKTFTCSECGYKKTDTLPIDTSHKHAYSIESVTPPTCTEAGYTTYVCDCGDSYRDNEVAALQHIWGTPVQNGDGTHTATCERDGTHKNTVNCTYTEDVTAPTCTDKGYTTFTCDCGYTYVGAEVNATDHKWGTPVMNGDGTHTVTCEHDSEHTDVIDCTYTEKVTAPTCTAAGFTTFTCACGYSYTDNEVAAKGHTYDEDTWTTTGSHHYHAATCGCEGEMKDSAAHTFETQTVAATCTAGGFTTYTCACGYTYAADHTPAKGHSVATWTEKSAVIFDNTKCEFTVTYEGECATCRETATKTEQAERHSTYERVTKTATCAADGEKSTFCASKDCKYNTVALKTTSYKDTATHAWNDKKDVEASTATMDVYKCLNCSASKQVATSNVAELENGIDDSTNEIELSDATIGLSQGIKDAYGDKDISLSVGTLTGDAKDKVIADAKLNEDLLDLLGNTDDMKIYNFTLTVNKPDGENPDDTLEEGQLGGTATIRLEYELQPGDDPGHIIVWFIEEGNLTAHDAVYAVDENGKGYVTFQTTHFSYYTVTRLTPAQRCDRVGHPQGRLKVVAPTCTQNGYTLCTLCGRQVEDSVEEATGHILGTTVTKAATCSENGISHVACSACDLSFDTPIAASGHYYVLAAQTAATCKAAGSMTHACAYCGDSYTVTTPQLSHSYVSQTVAPTCTRGGYTTTTCTACGWNVTTFNMPSTGHTSGTAWYATAEGHYRACTTCGEITERAEHVPGPEATEQTSQICTVCSYTLNPPKKHTHSLVKVDGIAPTCTTGGRNDYYVCACGTWFADEAATAPIVDHSSVLLSAKGHTTVNTPAEEPDCEKSGFTAGVYCTVCKTYLRGHIELSAYGHSYRKTTVAPTCTKTGLVTYTCVYCGDTDGIPSETLPMLEHSLMTVTVAPTCLADGYTTVSCRNCSFSEQKDVTLALGHIYGERYIATDGGHCFSCVRCDAKTPVEAHTPDYTEATNEHGITCVRCNFVIEEALDHTHAPKTSIPAVTPSCTTAGNIAYYICACGDWFYDAACQSVIYNRSSVLLPALSHAPTYHVGEKSTCLTQGYSAGVYCENCQSWLSGHEKLPLGDHSFGAWKTYTEPDCENRGELRRTCQHCYDYESQFVAPTGHAMGVWVTVVMPGCETAGKEQQSCKSCGHTVSRTVDALGHDTVAHVGKAPTCQVGGYADYVTCTRCDYTTFILLPATTEHAFGEWQQTVAPGCDTRGEQSRVCGVCGKTEFNYTAALGHDMQPVPGKTPTCSEAGYSESMACSRCDYKTDAQPLPPNGNHAYGDDGVCGDCGAQDPNFGTLPVYTYDVETNGMMLHYAFFRDGSVTLTAGDRVIATIFWVERDGSVFIYSDEALTQNTGRLAIENGQLVPYVCDEDAHAYTVKNFSAPTCSRDGFKVHFCTYCGDEYTETIPATGEHTFVDDWTTHLLPTCEQPGLDIRYCTVCYSASETREVYPLGHDLTSYPGSEPTCVNPGYLPYEQCSRCGHNTYTEIPATGEHTYEDGSCIHCGAADPNGGEENVEFLKMRYLESMDKTWRNLTDTYGDLSAYMEAYLIYIDDIKAATTSEQVERYYAKFLVLVEDIHRDMTDIPSVKYTYEQKVGDGFAYYYFYSNGKGVTTFGEEQQTFFWTEEGNLVRLFLDAALTQYVGAFTVNADGTLSLNICEDGKHDYVRIDYTAPTCGTMGYERYQCTVCAMGYGQSIPATGKHSYNDQGYCDVCGQSIGGGEGSADLEKHKAEIIDLIYADVQNFTAKHGNLNDEQMQIVNDYINMIKMAEKHEYVEGYYEKFLTTLEGFIGDSFCKHESYTLIDQKDATCTEQGYQIFRCDVCGETWTQFYIEGHVDNDGNGYCDGCGQSFGGEIDPTIDAYRESMLDRMAEGWMQIEKLYPDMAKKFSNRYHEYVQRMSAAESQLRIDEIYNEFVDMCDEITNQAPAHDYVTHIHLGGLTSIGLSVKSTAADIYNVLVGRILYVEFSQSGTREVYVTEDMIENVASVTLGCVGTYTVNVVYNYEVNGSHMSAVMDITVTVRPEGGYTTYRFDGNSPTDWTEATVYEAGYIEIYGFLYPTEFYGDGGNVLFFCEGETPLLMVFNDEKGTMAFYTPDTDMYGSYAYSDASGMLITYRVYYPLGGYFADSNYVAVLEVMQPNENGEQEFFTLTTVVGIDEKDCLLYCPLLGEFRYDASGRLTPAACAHDWITIEPSCYEDGYRRIYCRLCGEIIESEFIPAGHRDRDMDGYCDGCGMQMGSSDIGALRDETIQKMERVWQKIINQYLITDNYVQRYNELYVEIFNAKDEATIYNAYTAFEEFIAEIEKMGSDHITYIELGSNDYIVTVGTSIEQFLTELTNGQLYLNLNYSLTGTHQIPVTRDMIMDYAYGETFDTVAKTYRFTVYYKNDGFSGSCHLYVTAEPDMSSAQFMGEYMLSMNMDGQSFSVLIQLYDNGFARMTSFAEGETEDTVYAAYTQDGTTLYLTTEGMTVVLTVSETGTATFYQVTDRDIHLGTYYYQGVEINLYGDYKGAGEYIGLIKMPMSETTIIEQSVLMFLDLEERRIGCVIFSENGNLYFDEEGNIYCPHEYKVDYREPTCTTDGYRETQCTICGRSSYEFLPATGHNDKDGDGCCDSCGTFLGGEDEGLANYIRNECEKTYKAFYSLAGYDKYENEFNKYYSALQKAGSMEDAKRFAEYLWNLIDRVKAEAVDRVVNAYLSLSHMEAPVGTNIMNFLTNLLRSGDLYLTLEYSLSGTRTVSVDQSMLQAFEYGEYFEGVGTRYDFYVEYEVDGCSYSMNLSITVIPDVTDEDLIGRYTVTVLDFVQNGMRIQQILELSLFKGNYAKLVMRIIQNGEEEVQHIYSTYTQNGNNVYVIMEGVPMLIVLDDNGGADFWHPTESDTLIGEYVYRGSILRVYGEYKGAGQYVAIYAQPMPDGSEFGMSVIVNIDLENKTITSGIFGSDEYPMHFDEKGNIYCEHIYEVTEHREPTCYEDGWHSERCVICGTGHGSSIPALEHIDNNGDGACDNCGMGFGDVDEELYAYIQSECEQTKSYFYNLMKQYEHAAKYEEQFLGLYDCLMNATSYDEAQSFANELWALMEQIEREGDKVDRLEYVTLIQSRFEATAGTRIDAFLKELLNGRLTLQLHFSQSGIVTVPVSEEMLYNNSTEELFSTVGSEYCFVIHYPYEEQVHTVHVYVTVTPNLDDMELVGEYFLPVVDSPEVMQTMRIYLYEGGMAKIELVMSFGEEQQTQTMYTDYELDGDHLYLTIEGVSMLLILGEDGNASFYQPSENDTLIGTYTYQGMNLYVYGEYTGAGQYVCVILQPISEEAFVSLSVMVGLDLEGMTFTTALFNGRETTFSFDEAGNIYCNHTYEIVEHREPSCYEQGYYYERCTVCGQSNSHYTPALGHNDEDGDGYCDRCGMSFGGGEVTDELLQYIQSELQMLENEWNNLSMEGYDISPYKEQFHKLHSGMKGAASWDEAKMFSEELWALIARVREGGNVERDELVSIWTDLPELRLPTSLDPEVFLQNNVIGHTAFVEMTMSGVHELIITRDMIDLGGLDLSRDGQQNFLIHMTVGDSTYGYTVTVQVYFTTEGAEQIGTYTFEQMIANGFGFDAVTLYSNGVCVINGHMTMYTYYSDNIVQINIDGAVLMVVLNDDTMTAKIFRPEGLSVTTYRLVEEKMVTVFEVYGDYCGVGTYVTVVSRYIGDSTEPSAVFTTLVEWRLSGGTLYNPMLGEFSFDDNGNLYPVACRHEGGRYQNVAVESTCQQEGMIYLYCVECNERVETMVMPKRMHEFNEQGICWMCGSSSTSCKHSYNGWCFDDYHHFANCMYCGLYVSEPHDFSVDGFCYVCGYISRADAMYIVEAWLSHDDITVRQGADLSTLTEAILLAKTYATVRFNDGTVREVYLTRDNFTIVDYDTSSLGGASVGMHVFIEGFDAQELYLSFTVAPDMEGAVHLGSLTYDSAYLNPLEWTEADMYDNGYLFCDGEYIEYMLREDGFLTVYTSDFAVYYSVNMDTLTVSPYFPKGELIGEYVYDEEFIFTLYTADEYGTCYLLYTYTGYEGAYATMEYSLSEDGQYLAAMGETFRITENDTLIKQCPHGYDYDTCKECNDYGEDKGNGESGAPNACEHKNRQPVEGSENTFECLDCGMRFFETTHVGGGNDYTVGDFSGLNDYTASYTVGDNSYATVTP